MLSANRNDYVNYKTVQTKQTSQNSKLQYPKLATSFAVCRVPDFSWCPEANALTPLNDGLIDKYWRCTLTHVVCSRLLQNLCPIFFQYLAKLLPKYSLRRVYICYGPQCSSFHNGILCFCAIAYSQSVWRSLRLVLMFNFISSQLLLSHAYCVSSPDSAMLFVSHLKQFAFTRLKLLSICGYYTSIDTQTREKSWIMTPFP